MKKNNPTTFSEKELDMLLNRSFLESYLTKPENERMTEAVSAQVLGLNANTNFTRQSFSKKLFSKIRLRVLIFSSLTILGGAAGILLLKHPAAKPKKSNVNLPAIHNQPRIISSSKADTMQEDPILQNTSTGSHNNMYKKSIEKNNTTAQATYNDSASDNLVIQQLEPMHFNDPSILCPKNHDTLSANTKHIEKNNSKNDKQKKRSVKSKWREHEVKYDADHFH